MNSLKKILILGNSNWDLLTCVSLHKSICHLSTSNKNRGIIFLKCTEIIYIPWWLKVNEQMRWGKGCCGLSYSSLHRYVPISGETGRNKNAVGGGHDISSFSSKWWWLGHQTWLQASFTKLEFFRKEMKIW